MKVYIADARRTPIGDFLGLLADTAAVELGVAAVQPLLDKFEVADGVADVIFGNVLQAGQGMNPARQISLKVGLPYDTPAQTINRVCGSGMQAIITATQCLKLGEGDVAIAGGTENMSRAPFLAPALRRGHKMGDFKLSDSLVQDGLTDPTHHYHMGITAENIATKWKISRQEQDTFALLSHQRAADGWQRGDFREEIVPVEIATRNGRRLVDLDESIRKDTSLEALAKLRPVFKKTDGTVTAGNASGLNDGAAAVLLASENYVRAHAVRPLAEIMSYATVGVDPALMGIGPAVAIPAVLKKAGLALSEIDLFELNEAFAAQSLAVIRDLNLDEDRVNIAGGAIALGHPIGASGARIVVTLAHALRRTGQEFGIASLCIGGGMGIAMVLRAV
jgi:acetyl-CoA C-acetyltransferase